MYMYMHGRRVAGVREPPCPSFKSRWLFTHQILGELGSMSTAAAGAATAAAPALTMTPLQEALREAKEVLQVAKATRDKVKEERDPQDTYAARVAEAEIRMAEAEVDVKEAKYEIEKAKVEALLAANTAVGAAWTAAREDELLGAIKDKETALQAWNNAKVERSKLAGALRLPVLPTQAGLFPWK